MHHKRFLKARDCWVRCKNLTSFDYESFPMKEGASSEKWSSKMELIRPFVMECVETNEKNGESFMIGL
jgi:hypothetical protein